MSPFQVFRKPQVRASAVVEPAVAIYRTAATTAATATAKATHRVIGISADWPKYHPLPGVTITAHAETGDQITYHTAGTECYWKVGAVAIAADVELTPNASGQCILAVSGDLVCARSVFAAAIGARATVCVIEPYVKP